MTSLAPRTAAAATLAALAIAGATGVPAAQAGPMQEPITHSTPDLRVHMQTSSMAGTTSPSQVLSSPDARDAAAGRHLGSATGATRSSAAAPAVATDNGADWTAIALGAVGGAGLVLVLIAGTGLTRRRVALH